LNEAVEQSGAALDPSELFAGAGFSQLCLASGGVPRDFLSLFVGLANRAASGGDSIGKIQVTEGAIANRHKKLEAMKRDTGDDDEFLERCLYVIKDYVYSSKRTNAFLIAKSDLETNPQGRQAIRELVDLRLVHLVERNTSKAPSDGRRYEAYILDLGLYENARPMQFRRVQPGATDDKSRKDTLRASPVLELAWLTGEGLKDSPVIGNRRSSPSAAPAKQLKMSFE
jgi:hypothetical protein